ncbi:helix-turn-helix domain-containing protein [Gluconobacter oxydans]|uniref:helix-turn-helix domain-containing protein n=1 Tax=Gluconobacter oxydans TaxID=442 RepID=UPI0039EC28A1
MTVSVTNLLTEQSPAWLCVSMTLDEYLKKHELTDAEFARQSGINLRKIVGDWRRGTRRPDAENMRKILVYTSGRVTPNDFILSKDMIQRYLGQ